MAIFSPASGFKGRTCDSSWLSAETLISASPVPHQDSTSRCIAMVIMMCHINASIMHIHRSVDNDGDAAAASGNNDDDHILLVLH